jgi:amidase
MRSVLRSLPPVALALALTLAAGAGAHGQRPAFDVAEKSIAELQAAMTSGEVTSRQLVEAYLARIAAYDQQGPALNAVVAVNREATAQADALDAERRAGRVRGPLHGIPVIVKDNYETVEMPTGAGSLALAANHPPRDAFMVRKLREAGAVILAKANMHELAAGITTIASYGGQTRNPYDPSRNPGGSSGGTGAAVAASYAAAGMGSDTCGSIRVPSSHHALVGLRGTDGLSSRAGIVPLSHTQDIGGPLARSVTDLAVMLDATVGPDPADPVTTAGEGKIPQSYAALLGGATLKGARIGVVRSLFGTAPDDEEVARVVQQALDRMKALGAEPVDVVVPGLDDLLRDGSVIVHEFKTDLAAYLATVPNAPLVDPERIVTEGLYHVQLEGTFNQRLAPTVKPDPEGYRRARIKRTALRQALLATLEQHGVTALAYPTIRRKAARLGDAQQGTTCQVSAHSGLPALSVPAGYTDDGLPVGLELLGAAFDEAGLLRIGQALEQAAHIRRPPYSTPPLEQGKPPAPRKTAVSFRVPADAAPRAGELEVSVALSYDAPTARLTYQATVSGPRKADDLRALWLHRGSPDAPGPALQQLPVPPAWPASGTVTLGHVEREALRNGKLYLELYTRQQPLGAGRVPVVIPVEGR